MISMDIKYKVIRDTREQNGWTFMSSKACEGTLSGALKTGDYSIEGYEELLTIERKGSIAELANNLVEDRFERELERMESFKYAFMILEFSMDDLIKYPKGSGIPSYKIKSVKLNPQDGEKQGAGWRDGPRSPEISARMARRATLRRNELPGC